MRDPDDATEGSTSPNSAGFERTCPPDEWNLVQDILRGSVPAWHDFVVRYSGLIRAVLGRQLYTADADDIRAVYVDVLTHLYRGGLSTFGGRCGLGTWVTLATRARAMDFLRSRFGRHEPPGGLEELSPEDRDVFQMYYVQGCGLPEMVARRLRFDRNAVHGNRPVGSGGGSAPADVLQELLESLHRIEQKLGHRALRRYAEDAAARSLGMSAAHLLHYLEHVRQESTQQQHANSPEALFMRREAEQAQALVRRLVQALPEEDRLAVRLWFFRDWPAEELSRAIGLANSRRAYTVVQRGLRRLRRLMLAAGYDPREDSAPSPRAVAPERPPRA